jgi:WS/DGAT/MGAT family acyltransferase
MLAGGVAEIARAAGRVAGHGLVAPRSSLNRPTGRDRTLAFIRQDLAAVKAAGRAEGATVNDVVLAAVAGGLRSLYLARGESLPHDLHATVLVPVSLRDDAARGTLGNRVGVLLLPLPVGVGDPGTRLRTIAAASATMKAQREVLTSEVVQAAADFLPAKLVAPLSGLITHQPLANLVVTNVRGPAVPLYAMGAEMREAFPVVPLSGNLTIGVAALSYNGALNLGVTADSGACPDVDSFVSGVERSFAQLGARPDATARRVG